MALWSNVLPWIHLQCDMYEKVLLITTTPTRQLDTELYKSIMLKGTIKRTLSIKKWLLELFSYDCLVVWKHHELFISQSFRFVCQELYQTGTNIQYINSQLIFFTNYGLSWHWLRSMSMDRKLCTANNSGLDKTKIIVKDCC